MAAAAVVAVVEWEDEKAEGLVFLLFLLLFLLMFLLLFLLMFLLMFLLILGEIF